MKKIILIIIFLIALKTTYAQETPPPGLKSLPTASRFINPADSSIWTYKGAVLGWHREGKYGDLLKLNAGLDTGFIKAQYQTIQNAAFNVQFGYLSGGFLVGNTSGQYYSLNPGGFSGGWGSDRISLNPYFWSWQRKIASDSSSFTMSNTAQYGMTLASSNAPIQFNSPKGTRVLQKPSDTADIVRLKDLQDVVSVVDTSYIKNQYLFQQDAIFNVRLGIANHFDVGNITIKDGTQGWHSQHNAGNINIYKPEGSLYQSTGILTTHMNGSAGHVSYTLLADTINQVFRLISENPIVLDAPKVQLASTPTAANDVVRLRDLQEGLNISFIRKIDSIKMIDNVFTGANKLKNLIIPVDGGNGATIAFQNQNNTKSFLYYNGGSEENNGYLGWNGDYFQAKKIYVNDRNAEIGIGDDPNNGVKLRARGVVGSYNQMLQAADGVLALVGQAGQDPSVSNNYIAKSGGTMSGDLKLASATPSDPLSAAPKVYIDNLVTGITWKNAVRVKTTGTITLSGLQTIDGISVAPGNRVLVNNQTNTNQNGIYVASSSAWTRPTDADESTEITSSTVAVTAGIANKNTQWTYIGTNDPIVGTDPISYGQISGAGTYNASGGINLSANVFTLDQVFAKGLFSGAGSLTYNPATGQFSAPTVVSAFTNDANYQTVNGADAKYLPLIGGTLTGMQTIQSNSEQFRLAYAADPTKYTSFSVNSAGSINLSSVGSVSLTAAGANTTAFNNNGAESGRFDANGRLGVGTGATVSAKLHVVSTAEQIRAGYDASNFTSLTTTASGQSNFTSSLGSAGIYNFTGTVNVSGGLTQTGVNYNLVIPNSFQPSSVGAIYNMGGSTVQYIRTGFYGNSGVTMQAGSSYSNVEIAAAPITTSSSGTHPIVASLYLKAPSITATAGSTITNTATVAIEGQPTAATATNNYAFLVNSGLSQFNGNVGITSSATLFANIHSNSTSSNNALMTLGNNGSLFSRNVNDANAAVTINQQQGTGNIINWQYGSNNIAFINTAGRFSGEGLGNILTGANALIQPTSNGTVITRNVADANAALSVNQANSSSTGNVQEWLFNGSRVGAMTYLGNLFLNSIQNNGGASFSQVAVGNTGTTINRNINDANIALIVNQQQGTGAINAWRYGGSNVAFLNSSGTIFMNSGIANLGGANNAYINTSTVGTIISKNLNDLNPALIINNNQGTGNIANFQFGGSNKSSVNINGEYENLIPGNGILLKSPDGTRYRVAVANGGVIQATAL